MVYKQAQQELENRMKDMLAKISEIQNGKTVNTSVEDDRVKELERQVTSLTEQRIQHLEKLQEHQAELQVYLAIVYSGSVLKLYKFNMNLFCAFVKFLKFILQKQVVAS